MSFAHDAAPYDKRDGSPFFVNLGGAHTIAGTVASAVAITGSYYKVPFACKLLSATISHSTGTTAAGPTIHIDRSVGGTGSYAAIGTAAKTVIGTAASASTDAVTIAVTDLADGDVLRIENQANTGAENTRVSTVTLELIARADSVA